GFSWRKRASVRFTEVGLRRCVRCCGHIDRQHLRVAIVVASPRISLPSDGWLGVAGEQFPAGCEVAWRKGHGRIARRYGPTQNAAMRCRPVTPKTKRCAVARKETMRCRFAPTRYIPAWTRPS